LRLKIAYFYVLEDEKLHIILLFENSKRLQPGEAPFVLGWDNEEICKAQNISQDFRLRSEFKLELN